MKIWHENCKIQAKIQNSRICQIQQILLKNEEPWISQKTLNISQTLHFEEKIEKLQIEGKFNKIKIILKKVKTQQNFEKNQNFKKVQIWCKIEIQQILKKIQTKFKNSKSLEKILKISNFHKIVKIQQMLMKY